MKRILWKTLAIALVAIPVLARAQLPDPADPDVFTNALVAALTGGQWQIAIVLALVGAVYLLRLGGTHLPGAAGAFFATSRGGTVLALATALVTVLGANLYAGQPVGLKEVMAALVAGFAAIGGWTGLRRLLAIDGSKAPVLEPEAPRGMALISTAIGLAVAGAVLVLVLMVATASRARAAEPIIVPLPTEATVVSVEQLGPKYGGCLAGGTTCFGPSVSLSLASVSLRDGTTTFGIAPGVGYGATWWPGAWNQVGVSGYVAFRSTADGTKPVLSVVGSFAEYLRLGVGYQVGGGVGSFRDQAQLLLGIGADFGLSR